MAPWRSPKPEEKKKKRNQRIKTESEGSKGKEGQVSEVIQELTFHLTMTMASHVWDDGSNLGAMCPVAPTKWLNDKPWEQWAFALQFCDHTESILLDQIRGQGGKQELVILHRRSHTAANKPLRHHTLKQDQERWGDAQCPSENRSMDRVFALFLNCSYSWSNAYPFCLYLLLSEAPSFYCFCLHMPRAFLAQIFRT